MPYRAWSRDPRGSLTLNEELVSDLAERVGTPLYVYDLAAVGQRLEDLRSAFAGFEVSYAVKANPNRSVCSFLAQRGTTPGVSSPRDLEVALSAGFKASDAMFVGPGKDTRALEYALDSHVGLISVESLAEANRLDEVAKVRGTRCRVLLRVNTSHRATVAGEIMAGVASQFGIDEEQVPSVCRALKGSALDVVGFHTFVASQVLNREFLAFHFERVALSCVELAAECGFKLEVLNFGGGFGVPYSPQERGLAITELGAEVLEGPAGDLSRRDVRCVIDVGRYLTAESGLFLTRVVDVKLSRGSRFVVVECGISGMARPAMPWGQQHPVTLLKPSAGQSRNTYTVVGPSCMPGDVLSQSVQLTRPEPGDVVAIHNAGAYGLSMSPLAWGGFDAPRELTVSPNGDETLSACVVQGVY